METIIKFLFSAVVAAIAIGLSAILYIATTWLFINYPIAMVIIIGGGMFLAMTLYIMDGLN